tara:strand:+ start:1324 stop:1749 length:426 start_codon:yes stop_codon:yes gene_type:complete
MYNCITIVGNLGRDPEVKQTSKGSSYAILSVATNRTIKGEKETDWHKVIVWDDRIADTLARYTTKGSMVLLQGRLTYRSWEKDGQPMKTAEIHLDRFESKMKLLDKKTNGGEPKTSSYDEGGIDEPKESTVETKEENEVPF